MVEICDVALETLEVLKYFNTEFTSKISESFLNSLKELAKKSKLEVKIDANKKLSKFSTGQKLKFQFAFALSHKPKLLLLDEPVGNFDPEFRKEFLSILSEFIEDGEHSILISTNTTMELEAMADYITMIKRGKIVFSMEKEGMCEKYKLVKGEGCKIDLIDKDRIIYKESGSYQTTALVLNDEFYEYDEELVVEAPSIDDVMYYIVKGDENSGK